MRMHCFVNSTGSIYSACLGKLQMLTNVFQWRIVDFATSCGLPLFPSIPEQHSSCHPCVRSSDHKVRQRAISAIFLGGQHLFFVTRKIILILLVSFLFPGTIYMFPALPVTAQLKYMLSRHRNLLQSVHIVLKLVTALVVPSTSHRILIAPFLQEQ
ncbi:hypothetical protein HD554DRAFT_2134698 [Boletus coccyginus]|nr:hypothetical protein HD554DRAFT_2134698 [Boletus coccyginus]